MTPSLFDRRRFLGDIGFGLAGVALTQMMSGDLGAVAAKALAGSPPWVPGQPQFKPRAKQVLQIFCPGAASHIDLWDYKPVLEKHAGEPIRARRTCSPFRARTAT